MSGDARAPASERAGAPPGSATIDATLPARPVTPDESLVDERVVVRRVLDGDRDAFRILVEREGASVIRACQRVLGDRHEAEDVAQEAFVTAYRSLGSWRGDGTFGAWLARIAMRDAVRRASRRRVVTWVSPTPLADEEGDAIGGDGTPGGGGDPAMAVIRDERRVSIRAAVARLDEPYRETVALRFYADLSLAQIAAQTGRPLGTVKTHLRRGLLRLRESLAEGKRA